MSGTLGHIRRERQKQIDEQRQNEIRIIRQAQLVKNREDVIAEVCALFGWSKLDPFAQEMIDLAFAGEIVDIDKLKADIAAWKQAQEQPEEPQEETQDAAVSPSA